MPYSSYNFGIEIETVVRPYARRPNFTNQDWYKQLAQRLENRNIPAAPDLHSRYSTHPEYYSSRWFITRDGSLQRAHEEFVSMEIVSPVLNTSRAISKTLSEFWEAMSISFEVQKEKSCGGHVHVTPPSSTSRFSLLELKKVAFASVVYEPCVHAILPACRRNNRYCALNSLPNGTHGLGRACAAGLSASVLRSVRSSLQGVSSAAGLLAYMQASRYVIWNFANICPREAGGSCSGTLEFRGGSQFLNMKTTLKWIAFVVAFIHMALDENLLEGGAFNYVSASDSEFDAHMKTWWKSIRRTAAKLKVMRHLPENWKQMRIG